jgi:predicted nucleotidyltransferase
VTLICLVEPAESTSLFTIAGLKIDAEELLGVAVSLLTPNGLPPKFRAHVLQQAEPL